MNNRIATAQGQAWDQIALDRIGSEKQMDCLFAPNVEETDALFFSGGVRIAVPDVRPKAVKNLPPWERM